MCSYLLQHLRERDTLAHTNPLPFQGPPSLQHNSYSRVKHNRTRAEVFLCFMCCILCCCRRHSAGSCSPPTLPGTSLSARWVLPPYCTILSCTYSTVHMRWVHIALLSQDGIVSTWSPGLQVQRGVRMEEGGGGRGRGGKSALWVTDCVLMSDCHKLVVGTTSQELSFYDATTPSYRCQYRVQGI